MPKIEKKLTIAKIADETNNFSSKWLKMKGFSYNLHP